MNAVAYMDTHTYKNRYPIRLKKSDSHSQGQTHSYTCIWISALYIFEFDFCRIRTRIRRRAYGFLAKNIKSAFFRETSFFNQIFNQFIACMRTAWCTKLNFTQKVEISEETEFLRIFQKSHFSKSDYRF